MIFGIDKTFFYCQLKEYLVLSANIRPHMHKSLFHPLNIFLWNYEANCILLKGGGVLYLHSKSFMPQMVRQKLQLKN